MCHRQAPLRKNIYKLLLNPPKLVPYLLPAPAADKSNSPPFSVTTGFDRSSSLFVRPSRLLGCLIKSILLDLDRSSSIFLGRGTFLLERSISMAVALVLATTLAAALLLAALAAALLLAAAARAAAFVAAASCACSFCC